MQAQYIPSPAPIQQPVRVRLSCDSCSAAKVKCDKVRPACERCSSNQLRCTYSVSRRHGCKRRLAREPADTITHRASPRGGGGGGGAAGGGGSGSSASATTRDTVAFSTYDNSKVSGSSTANEGLTFHSGNDLPDPYQYLADDDFAMSVDLDGSKFSAFAFGNLPTPSDTSQNAYPQATQRQAPWTPFTTPSTPSVDGEDFRNSGYNVTLPAAFQAIDGAFDRLTDSHKNPNQFTGNQEPKKVHDCEAYALTLLRSLHRPIYSLDKHNHITSSNQACPISETYDANSNANSEVAHSLDTILYANKCALSGVVKLLDCSCAQRPHLATLCLAIITKMLSLYEIAATMDISSSDCPSSASPSSATRHDSSGPRLARNTIIQVGVFDLDEEDQATLQRGILLRQLRKMEKGIEKFASLAGGDANDHDVRQWHGVAISMIKKELQRIYQNCKERLPMIA